MNLLMSGLSVAWVLASILAVGTIPAVQAAERQGNIDAVAVLDSTASEEAKRDFVNHMAQDAVSILHDHRRSFSERQTTLENAFVSVVDVQWIARFVLGRNWQAASDEQRRRYTTLYRRYLTKTYISNFDENADRKIRDIKILHIGATEDEKFSVRTKMLLANAESVRVDYLVRDKDNRYKVIDIAVEGVSLLASHRAHFGKMASAQGIEAVIGALEQITSGKTTYAMALPLPSASQ